MIEVLAGLDNVDSVFFDLVDSLDLVVKDGRSSKLQAGWLFIHYNTDTLLQLSIARKPFVQRLQLCLEVTRLPLYRTLCIETSSRL